MRRAIHPAVQGEAAAVAPSRVASPMAALLSGHVLRDGEIVILLLRASPWFIVLNGLRFIAVVLIFMMAAAVFDDRLPGRSIAYQELGIFLLAGRLMYSTLQWMGRIYILTDMRVVRLSGVFSVEILDCPLRKIARTRLLRPMRERLLRLGTIEIISCDDSCSDTFWHTIARPREVHEQIVAAMNRARQGAFGAK